MQEFLAELHVHTVLSPCAEVEMIPPLIVREALAKGIQIIAIADHNSSANVKAVIKAAEGSNLTVIPGIEIQSKEEVHILGLFDTIEQLKKTQLYIDENMPETLNNPDFFGEQFVVDETGEFIRREGRLLITSCSLSFEEIFAYVDSLGGLAIPAHVDRSAYGLFAVLGFLPTDIHFEAIEISRNLKLSDISKKYPQIVDYPIIQSGDAHRLEEILGLNTFFIEEPSIAEFKKAFRKEDHRSLHIRAD